MFGVRRYRGASKPDRTALLIFAVGVTILAGIQPASAGGRTAADSDGRSISGTAHYPGGARPTRSDCRVEGYQGTHNYSIANHYGLENESITETVAPIGDNGKPVEQTPSEEADNTNKADRQYGEDDADIDKIGGDLIKEEGQSAGGLGPEVVTFNVQTQDGKFALDGEGWSVWRVFCGDAKEASIVAVPDSPLGLVPGALDFIEDYVPEPDLTLQPFDKQNDWTYVQSAIDFRTPAATLQPVVITADTGGPFEVRRWITITATPTTVRYDSGDTTVDPSYTECPAENADDPYVPETPGTCSFRYRNGSSIAENGKFEAELSIIWEVEFVASDGSSGSLDMDPTVQQEDVAVAEVKAVTVSSER